MRFMMKYTDSIKAISTLLSLIMAKWNSLLQINLSVLPLLGAAKSNNGIRFIELECQVIITISLFCVEHLYLNKVKLLYSLSLH